MSASRGGAGQDTRPESATRGGAGVPVERLVAAAYTIPAPRPESDGTLEWAATTIVVVQAYAGGRTGLGYTYGAAAAARLIHDELAGVVAGRDATAVPAAWAAMNRAVRNLGRPGIAATAISAVDVALWDLKARLFELPLITLLGRVRESVPVYASGGFTSWSPDRLRAWLGGWIERGVPRVKIKVGRDPAADPARVRAAREAIGPDAELFVDANGAYDRKQALRMAAVFAGHRVSWFEEAVSSDDLEGLRLIRDRAPPGMEITAGEYGYDVVYFRRMLEAGAVDLLMPDATRCGGVTGFLAAGALCDAFATPCSAHTAPALHLHLGCAVPAVRHIEYFHDHVRVEHMLFDGVPEPEAGELRPDLSRPGVGLELKERDAQRHAA